jgi:hypothetical protein
MTTMRQGIYALLSAVQLDTKEEGRTHVKPWPSQRIIIDGICKGLSEGCHEFVILKSRQMACTTVCSVIELFWALANPGTQGAIIADRGDNLERLRRIFASLLETLPSEWRDAEHRLLVNNRTGLTFANRSVIDLLAAGNNPDLGASRALNMIHATECALWKSLAGVESLKASMARLNPNRLYVWESIANGLNWYYRYCKQAKVDRHMRFIFVGFWANPTYTIPKSDPDFRVYWEGGTLTEDEIKRARFVKENYGYTVKPEQIAWWRREAEFKADEYMLRHYPWTETECFIASGSGFFPAKRTMEIAEAMGDGIPYQGYKYIFTEDFLTSRIERTLERDEVTLRVWEPPVPEGRYVIGIDPSGGGTDEASDHAIEVFRCYANRLVQVAEFQDNKPLTYHCAWVLAHLAGAYRNHIANLEVTGVGAAVMPEVRNLRLMAERGIIQAGNNGNILDMIGCVHWFLYNRADSLGGAGNVINWKTNFDNRNMVYSELRDTLMKGHIEIRSSQTIAQLQAIVFDQGTIGAGGDTAEKDDLVDAIVLAHHTWVRWIRDGMVANGQTWERVHETPPKGDAATVLSDAVSRFWIQVNGKARERRERF